MKIKEITFLILVIFFFGCEDKTDSDHIVSGPEVEWISGGTTTTYSYSGGVFSGYYFHRSFTVLNQSGDVTIDVQVQNNNGTKVSDTFNVEKGMQYSIKVKGSISGRQVSSPGTKCLTVIFSSPNSLSTQEIIINSYPVSSGIGDTYYCPSSLNFGELSILEL